MNSPKFWLTAFKSEFMLRMFLMRSYLFETLSYFVAIYAIFLISFYGIMFSTAGQVVEQNMNSIVIGYFVWILAFDALAFAANQVVMESQTGSVEQLHLSPAGFHNILNMRIIVGFFITVLLNFILFEVAVFTVGVDLEVPLLRVLGVIVLALPAVYGIGFILAGVTMIHKRVSSMFILFRFAVIGLVVVNAYPLNPASFLPFASGAETIDGIVNKGETYPAEWYLFIVANSALYYGLGFWIFRMFEKKAKRMNVIGHF